MEVVYTPEQVRQTLFFVESMGTDRFLELSDHYAKKVTPKQVRDSLAAWNLIEKSDQNSGRRASRHR